MDIKTIVETLLGIITLLTAGIVLKKSWKQAPIEVKSTDADLSAKFQDLADRQLERANEYEEKLDEYKKTTQIEISQLKKEVSLLTEYYLDAMRGIRILLKQFTISGIIPEWTPENLPEDLPEIK